MANDAAAAKLVGHAAGKASGKDALGSGKLVAYGIEKASGNAPTGAGKLVGYTVLSTGIVLAWPHGDDLEIQTSAALAAAMSLASAPAASPSDNVLVLTRSSFDAASYESDFGVYLSRASAQLRSPTLAAP